MKLAALAARIDVRRQCIEQRVVEHAPGERAIEMPRIDADEPRPQATRHHLACEHVRIAAPQRIHAGHPVRGELLLAVRADVLEEQIAEHDVDDVGLARACERAAERRLVLLVRARRRQLDHRERQPGGLGLRLEQRASHAMHRHAVVGGGHGREQPDDLDVVGASCLGQRVRTVLPATPRQKRLRPGHCPCASTTMRAMSDRRFATCVALVLLVLTVARRIAPHPWDYAPMLAIALLGRTLVTRRSILATLVAALGAGLVFFVVSNFGVWLGTMYPHSASGLADCFVAALPCYRNQLVGDLLFAGALFGLHAAALDLRARVAARAA